MSELVRESKVEDTRHMEIFSHSAHGPLEVQLLHYAKLRKLDEIFVALFEDNSGIKKYMHGSCYPLSALIRLSKKMEEKSASSKERDDFPRLQAYIKAISVWDRTEKSLMQKIAGFDETVEVAFSRMIGYIWQLQHLDKRDTELLSSAGVVRHTTEYEYRVSFFFKKTADLVTQLLKHPNIFRANRQIEITLMPYRSSKDGGAVLDEVGHRVTASKTALGFALDDSRNKVPFQHFAATDYEKFLKAIFAAGDYQISPEDVGLCVTFRVERPLQIGKARDPKPTQTEAYVYPHPVDLWPKAAELPEKEKNLLLFAAAKCEDRFHFDFWLHQIKTIILIETYEDLDVFYWLVKSNNHDQLIKLLDRLKPSRSTAGFFAEDQEKQLAEIREKIQGNPLFLRTAAVHDCVTVLEPLIAFGCDPFALDEDEMTAFMRAAFMGNLAVVKKFLTLNPDLLHVKSPDYGFTVLHWLANSQTTKPKQLEVLRELLAMGADQTLACNYGCLPFYLAVQQGNVEAMKILLSAAAEPALQLKIIQNVNDEGESAITYLMKADDQAAWDFVLGVIVQVTQSTSSELDAITEPAVEPLKLSQEVLDFSAEDQAQPPLFAVPDIKSRAIAVVVPAQCSFFAKPAGFIADTGVLEASTTMGVPLNTTGQGLG